MSSPSELRIWYVCSQRLCNYRCPYCVSVGPYAKSNRFDWLKETDQADVETVVRWIAAQPYTVGVRLATLGEPFASWEFLNLAAWLTSQPRTRFVELLTNGSLLKRRLPKLAERADLSRLSLWITYHHTETTIDRVIDAATLAQNTYGIFTVVNGLLFPDNHEHIAELRTATAEAGLRFNLDPGYDPGTPAGEHDEPDEMAPLLRDEHAEDRLTALGADPRVLSANLAALRDTRGQPCSAGSDYLYIGIDGEVYPCSRYYVLAKDRLGSALDPDFRLTPRHERFSPCQAAGGCCNKEDFLHLQTSPRPAAPSLGWINISPQYEGDRSPCASRT